MASKACIGVGLAMIEMTYPGKYNPENSKKIAIVWHEMFISVSDELFLSALKRCIATCTFPPSIADVTNKIKEEILQLVSYFMIWNDFCQIVQVIDDYVNRFGFTSINKDGMLEGTKAKLDCKKYYDSLPLYVRQFFSSYSGAINCTEVMADPLQKNLMQKSFLNYIKSRFDNSRLEELREIIDHFQLDKKDKMFQKSMEHEHDILETFQSAIIAAGKAQDVLAVVPDNQKTIKQKALPKNNKQKTLPEADTEKPKKNTKRKKKSDPVVTEENVEVIAADEEFAVTDDKPFTAEELDEIFNGDEPLEIEAENVEETEIQDVDDVIVVSAENVAEVVQSENSDTLEANISESTTVKPDVISSDNTTEIPVKRKPGRPRKNAAKPESAEVTSAKPADDTEKKSSHTSKSAAIPDGPIASDDINII